MRYPAILLLCIAAFSWILAQDGTNNAAQQMNMAKCISHAKQIAQACKLYASGHNGNYPKKLEDLLPFYITDSEIFADPLSAKKEAMGYEYFGAGATDSNDPAKVLLRSKNPRPDGQRVYAFCDGSAVFRADK